MIRKNYQVRQSKVKKQILTQLIELKCEICQNKDFISFRMQQILYEKHSSNQNYNYINDVKDILIKKVNSDAINFRFYESFDEEREFLKTFYDQSNSNHKLKLLGNYYKFHSDIPRIFISSFMNIFNQFHNVKRRIYYHLITSQLKKEQNNNNENPQDLIEIKKVYPKKIENPVLANVSVVKKFEPSIIVPNLNDQSQNTTNLLDYFLKTDQSNADITQIYEQNKSYDKLHSFLQYMDEKKQKPYKPQLKLELRRPQSQKPTQILKVSPQQTYDSQNYILYSQKVQNQKYIDIRKQQQQQYKLQQEQKLSQKSLQLTSQKNLEQYKKESTDIQESYNQQIKIEIHKEHQNNDPQLKQQSIIRQNVLQKQPEQKEFINQEQENKNYLLTKQNNVRSSLQDLKQMKKEIEIRRLSLSREKKKSTFVVQSPIKQIKNQNDISISKHENISLLTMSNNNMTTNNQTQQSQIVQQQKNLNQHHNIIGSNKTKSNSSLKMIQEQKSIEKQGIFSGETNAIKMNSSSIKKLDVQKSKRVVVPPSKQQVQDNILQCRVSNINKTDSLMRTNNKSQQNKHIIQLYINFGKNQIQSHQVTKSVSNLQLTKIYESHKSDKNLRNTNDDQLIKQEKQEIQELNQEKHHMKSKSDQIQVIRKNQYQLQPKSPYMQVLKDNKNVQIYRKQNIENLRSSQSVKKILQAQDGSFRFFYNKNQ